MDTEKLSGDLRELALDLRWSWNHAADNLWGQLDPELWELTRNPWVMLQTVSQEKLEGLQSDAAFTGLLETLRREGEARRERQRWFQESWPDSKLRAIAYFSMEFMLSDALPIYSGGLGNVAGDQLKAANDLGVPVLRWGCFTSRAISGNTSTPRGSSMRSTLSTIRANCPSRRCARVTANGCASR